MTLAGASCLLGYSIALSPSNCTYQTLHAFTRHMRGIALRAHYMQLHNSAEICMLMCGTAYIVTGTSILRVLRLLCCHCRAIQTAAPMHDSIGCPSHWQLVGHHCKPAGDGQLHTCGVCFDICVFKGDPDWGRAPKSQFSRGQTCDGANQAFTTACWASSALSDVL